MSDLNDLRAIDNLKRAWRWIRSNPDNQYKSHFRPLYSAYAIAADDLLSDLSSRLRRGIYAPHDARKLLVPKPSGIARPYSLLCVEDQIVYQAAVNVVAERFAKRVRHRYYKEVFGHLYAGKKSIWFYRKWSKGYSAFNEACRQAFADGYCYAASFDLTACYDSIDHGVLRHFLDKCGCDQELCATLTAWLSTWTSVDQDIYHNHGIPQGPLSSGLLAEVVLQHFDANRGKPKRVRYLRYVDDIKLFAKSEIDLRRMLIRLDELSKQIGLFPQSSKIEIHKVVDIDSELKSVSRPVEESIRRKSVDQKKVRKRIVQLSKRYTVNNPTRFKYVLAHATPHSTITSRLWRIYARHPDLYPSIARYLSRYARLPVAAAKEITGRLRVPPLYPTVTAAFVAVCNGRTTGSQRSLGLQKVKRMWKPNRMQDDLLAAAGNWLLAEGRLSYDQMKYAVTKCHSWWGRSHLVLSLQKKQIGDPSYEHLLNLVLRDTADDVALAASMLALSHGVAVQSPIRAVNRSAKYVLRTGGAIRSGPGAACGIESAIQRMLGRVPSVNWRAFFGSSYRKVERQIVCIAGYNETDVTAWVNAMDVFNDWLLYALHTKDTSIGVYELGSIGGSLNNRARKAKYPAVSALTKGIHERRYQSNLSHAVQRASGKVTGPIRWNYFRTGRKLLHDAVVELAGDW